MNKHWERDYKKGAVRIRKAALWAFIGWMCPPDEFLKIDRKWRINQ